MQFDIKVLGNLEARVGDVSFVPTATKPRQVLTMLVLNLGRVVPSSMLMTEMWGATPPRAASTTLQTYIGKLRRGLETALDSDAPQAKRILATEQGGYSLNLLPEDLDLSRYEMLAAVGRVAAEQQDLVTASVKLSAALALWRGPALTDVVQGTHMAIEAVRLEESRLADLDLRLEMDLRLGRHSKLLGELAGLCARFPMSENFCAKYMLALCRSGQQWRALDAFHRLRTVMVDELGVDPSIAIRRLHTTILRNDPTIDNPDFSAASLAPEKVLAR
jgi:SARP family transcriptional regulator, regulator of embCAB operon